MWRYKLIITPEGKHIYEAMNTCEECGKEFRALNPAPTKYCPECQKEIYRSKNAERVRRYRERKRQTKVTPSV